MLIFARFIMFLLFINREIQYFQLQKKYLQFLKIVFIGDW